MHTLTNETLPLDDKTDLLSTQEAVRIVRQKMIEMIARPGPFTEDDKRGEVEALTDQACALFPDGPPRSGFRWVRNLLYTAEGYSKFVVSFFRKTLECPIISRWYIVEKVVAYLHLFEAFSLTKHIINRKTSEPKRWPVDNVVAEEDQAKEYKERSKTRFQKVLQFIGSPDYLPMLSSTLISSRARWMFARHIQRGKKKNPEKARGASAALDALLKDYREILSCEDIVSDYVIERVYSPPGCRLQTWNGLARALLYFSEKNRPYRNDFRNVIQKKCSTKVYLNKLDPGKCCMESGTAGKITRVMRPIVRGSVEHMVECASSEACLHTFADESRNRGGSDSTSAERLFSEGRALGLRMSSQLNAGQIQRGL